MMAYSQYKPSISPWVNSIPAHWDEIRNGGIFIYHQDKVGNKFADYELLSLTTQGIRRKNIFDVSGKVPASYEGYQEVNNGDMVFCLFDLDCSAVFSGISDYHGMITSAYDVMKPRENLVNPKYLDYWFRSVFAGRYYKIFSKSVRYTINYDVFKALKTPVPPREEQDQIVRYLDWQFSKINKLIHGYQRQIKLLEERKTAIINNAVTKGLNPDVEYKPVESNWTGDIPSHWDFGAIKQHFQIQKRIAGKEGYDVLSITQQGLKIKNVASNEGQIAASYANYQFVYPGDFAMNHMDLLTGYVGLSEFFGVTSPDYRVFTISDTENCNPEYYLYIFQLCYKRRIFYGLGKGAASKGRWRMPAISFKNFGIPIPPMTEQTEIVAFIKEQEKKIGELIAGIEKNIESLKEYRTRLISDVVTGQMDVSGIKIPDYEAEADVDFENEADENDDTMGEEAENDE